MPRSRSAKLRAPKPTVAASKLVVGVGQRERVGPFEAQRRRLARGRASSIRSEKSHPTTSPPRPTARASAIARSPVPVATSSARLPGPTAASSTARARQRWCRPAVMTVFIAS